MLQTLSRRMFLVATPLAALAAGAALQRAPAALAATRRRADSGPIADLVEEAMVRFNVPGVAVGILHDGAEETAGFGVTSIENPLPVDSDTLFLIGSITKTFTAAAVLALGEQGQLDLDTPVRHYLPEFQLTDADVAERVTLRHLLTHTSGWAGELITDPGPGDDALAKVLAEIATVPQLAPLGQYFNYSNSGFALIGRVVERVAGKPFETAMRNLVLGPLGMAGSFFTAGEAITHRVAVGHYAADTGPAVVRQWAQPRASAPFGGLISSLRDQLRYARMLLGEQPAAGAPLLSPATLTSMRSPQGPGGTLEYDDVDAVGLGWMLRTVQQTRVLQHAGFVGGQQSLLLVVPERQFAIVVLTNAVEGILLQHEVSDWALEHYLGLRELALGRRTLPLDERLPYVGRYPVPLPAGAPIESPVLEIGLAQDGLELRILLPPALGSAPSPPLPLAFYAPDRVVVTDGVEQGLRCDFVRLPDGDIGWFRFGGRLHPRAP